MTRLRTQEGIRRYQSGEPVRGYRVTPPVPETRTLYAWPIIWQSALVASFVAMIVLAFVEGGVL